MGGSSVSYPSGSSPGTETAFATGLVVAALVGGLADRLVVQRFFWAPRLVLTVATIGLAQILSGIELILPRLFGGGGPLGGLSGGFKTPLPVSFQVSPLLFSGAHVQVLIIVPVVLGAMTLFLRLSAIGVAIRASSSNAERAMLLGSPVRRLSTVVWAVAATLSGLSAMLAAPLVGSGSGATSGPALLLPALAYWAPFCGHQGRHRCRRGGG
ncbi:MAG: ABC transporter permease subunit [Acidimicrobiia bacterium]